MISGVKAAVERGILDPKYHSLLTIVKGARNGIVYGTKIRFPHALVMVFLFASGTPKERLSKVVTATRQHATRLGMYVALYHFFILVQRKMNLGKEDNLDPLIAGMLGGWIMFGDLTPVNEQIVLYCIGRIASALLPRAKVSPDHRKGDVIPIDKTAFKICAAVTWGTIMWLFVHKRERLNRGLVSSMDCACNADQICTCSRASGTACETLSGTTSRIVHEPV